MAAAVPVKAVRIGLRSRLGVLLIRLTLKPLLAHMARAPVQRILALQIRAAGNPGTQCCGLPLRYRVGNGVPGQVLGDADDRGKLAILHLHGGAFLLPASPHMQLNLLGRLCAELGAVGFMPDYRLAPLNPAPAALDDCERAYRGLLDSGFAPERIAVSGDSAGGNLVLGLLQRIRKAALPMPACAVLLSPVTELGRVHAPPSRAANARHEAMLPAALMCRKLELYAGGQDASDPELSPLYADYAGFPPLYFIAGEREKLLDDSVLAAGRARDAGVETQLDVWPVLPHAFPLFGSLFVEAAQARQDIAAFIRRHVVRGGKSTAEAPPLAA